MKKKMLSEQILRKEYGLKKSEIKKRLSEFNEIGRKDHEALFIELCYCLCTPQSKAEKVDAIMHKKNTRLLKGHDRARLAVFLRGNCRFHNNKARYIVEARGFIRELKSLPRDPVVARDFLVKNIRGLGYKEASHFLRNIGYRNICIIDRHIVNTMHELGVFKKREMPKNPKEYLKMEERIKDYAQKIKINVDELDLLLWSIKTGRVLK